MHLGSLRALTELILGQRRGGRSGGRGGYGVSGGGHGFDHTEKPFDEPLAGGQLSSRALNDTPARVGSPKTRHWPPVHGGSLSWREAPYLVCDDRRPPWVRPSRKRSSLRKRWHDSRRDWRSRSRRWSESLPVQASAWGRARWVPNWRRTSWTLGAEP
ncbi:hypothetical protein D187_005952 [Cystobacter fuscus DSM 2262]|uniref:Uncharacterized protein n=1 Tax=Cystobacter fuscus (strain ATCC 25194 / DSM 2262 / NBRC 100088 / M29) TaxID=1242864 RepID=S9PKL8_CYSF2|nr:hypothetical protein D187_005952 [Cystobacter fuscus DSM 2262]